MTESDTTHSREPNVDGIWRVELEDNRHIEQVEDLQRGVSFVGYWSDGRAMIYNSGIHSVHLERVHADRVIRRTDDSDTRRVLEPHIEAWIRNNTCHIAALHPRYYWILEEDDR